MVTSESPLPCSTPVSPNVPRTRFFYVVYFLVALFAVVQACCLIAACMSDGIAVTTVPLHFFLAISTIIGGFVLALNARSQVAHNTIDYCLHFFSLLAILTLWALIGVDTIGWHTTGGTSLLLVLVIFAYVIVLEAFIGIVLLACYWRELHRSQEVPGAQRESRWGPVDEGEITFRRQGPLHI